MVTHEEIMNLLNPFVKDILDIAELSLPKEKFPLFRKLTLDRFGKSGFGKELERVLRSQAR
jgi:hypothetical protein